MKFQNDTSIYTFCWWLLLFFLLEQCIAMVFKDPMCLKCIMCLKGLMCLKFLITPITSITSLPQLLHCEPCAVSCYIKFNICYCSPIQSVEKFEYLPQLPQYLNYLYYLNPSITSLWALRSMLLHKIYHMFPLTYAERWKKIWKFGQNLKN